jgi:hypothetical protein
MIAGSTLSMTSRSSTCFATLNQNSAMLAQWLRDSSVWASRESLRQSAAFIRHCLGISTRPFPTRQRNFPKALSFPVDRVINTGNHGGSPPMLRAVGMMVRRGVRKRCAKGSTPMSPDGNGSSNQEGRKKAGNRALSSDRRLAVKRQRIPAPAASALTRRRWRGINLWLESGTGQTGQRELKLN